MRYLALLTRSAPLWLAAPLLLTAPAVYALDCAKADNTLEINDCAQQKQEAVERKLNTVYQQMLKQIAQESADNPDKKDLQKQFVQAQRLWISFREADCKAMYTYWIDGSIRNLRYLGCMQDHAEQRIKEIEAFDDV